MKTLLTILLITSHFCFLGQRASSEKIVKSGKIFTNRELSYYFENDSRGNTIFTKNDGMNGPITMLFVGEFDSLNRETRNYFAHSNIGFSISENTYESDRILHYEYYTDSVDEGAYERAVLNTINSQQEFLASKTIQELLRSEKRLTGIDILDANKNIITEIYFSEEGDTSSVNMYEYDSNNRQVLFRYGIHNEEPWTWDIYSFYDSHSNLIQSIRLSSENNIKDTTEIYNYHYDSSQKLISESYYHKKDFGNRTEYFYNANGHVIEERFYEGEEFVLDVLTKYKYTPEGMLSKKIQRDFRVNRKGKKDVFRYEVRYW